MVYTTVQIYGGWVLIPWYRISTFVQEKRLKYSVVKIVEKPVFFVVRIKFQAPPVFLRLPSKYEDIEQSDTGNE